MQAYITVLRSPLKLNLLLGLPVSVSSGTGVYSFATFVVVVVVVLVDVVAFTDDVVDFVAEVVTTAWVGTLVV